jgi:hypothetical protein
MLDCYYLLCNYFMYHNINFNIILKMLIRKHICIILYNHIKIHIITHTMFAQKNHWLNTNRSVCCSFLCVIIICIIIWILILFLKCYRKHICIILFKHIKIHIMIQRVFAQKNHWLNKNMLNCWSFLCNYFCIIIWILILFSKC